MKTKRKLSSLGKGMILTIYIVALITSIVSLRYMSLDNWLKILFFTISVLVVLVSVYLYIKKIKISLEYSKNKKSLVEFAYMFAGLAILTEFIDSNLSWDIWWALILQIILTVFFLWVTVIIIRLSLEVIKSKKKESNN